MKAPRTSGGTIPFLARAAAVLLLLVLPGPCPAGDAPDQAAKPSFRPRIIYVADFSLDSATDAEGRGLHGPLQIRKRLRDRVDQTDESPEEKAARIRDTLARSIVSELTGKNVNCARLEGQARPSSGTWLLEGEFVEYYEGDRLKKAVIGFGSGSSDMEVKVKLSEVMDGGLRPIFDSTIEGRKNRLPGAAVTKNPYVAGAKYVLSKKAPDREVKKLGARIAEKLYDYMEEQGESTERGANSAEGKK